MNKLFLIAAVFSVSGCLNETAIRSGPVKWESAGTLVSVGPDTELSRPSNRLESAIIGETTFGRTRIETTEGVYIVGDKVGFMEIGAPVSVGYSASDQSSGTPSYLTLGGKRYQIVR